MASLKVFWSQRLNSGLSAVRLSGIAAMVLGVLMIALSK